MFDKDERTPSTLELLKKVEVEIPDELSPYYRRKRKGCHSRPKPKKGQKKHRKSGSKKKDTQATA
ncbi:hypothetical protein MUP46_00555 [Patescibacteria group bacterium]|nr:hypothetical protein [Patescibacteria group bacterium]